MSVLRRQAEPQAYRERFLAWCHWDGLRREYNSTYRVKDSLMLRVEFEDQIEPAFYAEMARRRDQHLEFCRGKYYGKFPQDYRLLFAWTMNPDGSFKAHTYGERSGPDPR